MKVELVRFLMLSLFLICFTAPSHAVVTLRVSDDGTDTTLTWSGMLNVGSSTGSLLSTPVNRDDVSNFFGVINSVYSVGASPYFVLGLSGSVSFNPVILPSLSQAPSSGGGGGAFGVADATLYWEASIGASPGTISPTRSWTFAGQTVASIFGTNLDAGPVTFWIFNATRDTIQIALDTTAVPEPSFTGFLVLAGLAMGLRRSRRRGTTA